MNARVNRGGLSRGDEGSGVSMFLHRPTQRIEIPSLNSVFRRGRPLPDLYIVGFILFGIFVSVMSAGRYGGPRSPEH